MKQKVLTLLLLVPLIFSLAACSSLQLPGSTSSTTSGQNQSNLPANTANQPVEDKLALGTLSLEGTDKAITAEQAKTLLPLWKAVKSLGNSSSASSDEVTALYKQIQEAMTADQVQAIKDLKLSQDDTQTLMKKYGVEFPQGGPQGMPTMSADQKATMQARRSSSSGNTQGGGQDGGGMPPDGGGAGGPPGGDISGGGAQGGAQQGQTTTQGTPAAPQGGRGMRGGMNIMLADTLIKLLAERAG
jgi:hypothetical protein